MRGWIIALIITLAAASYQRITGPTFPARGTVVLSGARIPYRLARSHAGPGNQLVTIEVADTTVSAVLMWRRYPTDDPETATPMRREVGRLVGELPRQPPAGKIEYRIQLRRAEDAVLLPAGGPVITRFKGDVPITVLIPHILLMFCAMLYSNRAMIEVFQKRRNLPHYVLGTSTMLFVGGLILGPIIQKCAFGKWWTGVPFGYDLTDNKTLIALVVWLLAGLFVRRPRVDRVAVFVAAVVTLIVFAIPHSLRGSEYKYDGGRALSEVVVP
jgi:hypothetical protein